jgi:TIR domain
MIVRKYHVALSFAGEDREYVDRVAAQLASDGVDVFYDKYEEANLWGKDLYSHLKDVYEKSAIFTVMFISEHYKDKLWTNHERKAAQARAFEESDEEYILPAFFGKPIEVPGLTKTTGYISLSKKTPEQVAQLITDKLVAAGVTLPKQFSYDDAAKADIDFPMPKGSAVTKIITDLKSYTWPRQEPAIKAIFDLDWSTLSPDQIFVLGRNIYQCADGNENRAKEILNNLRSTLAQIPSEAATHLLNGMFFEAYFDRRGELRKELKGKFLGKLLELQEVKKFASSISFIRRALTPYKTSIPFLPNTVPEMVVFELSVKKTAPPLVKSLKLNGREFLREDDDSEDYHTRVWKLSFVTFTMADLKARLCDAWSIPPEQLQVVCTPKMNAKTEYRLPKGFSIRWPKS